VQRHSDGRVLVTGGEQNSGALASAEIYDPKDESWTATVDMHDPRSGHTATLLADGRALVVGGWNGEGPKASVSAELFDPATGSWTGTGSLNAPRASHTATRLTDGRILVAGGVAGVNRLATAIPPGGVAGGRRARLPAAVRGRVDQAGRRTMTHP
jgi:N-acetylneuraminic acid mutarotase